MKQFAVLLALGWAGTGISQTAGFENLNLPSDTFYNGQDSSTYLSSGIEFTVLYDTSFGGFWSGGIAASTMGDTVTGDYSNLYSSITGGGYNSATYGVVTPVTGALIDDKNPVPPGATAHWQGMYITNTTYAYKSMLNGDAFAKKFGGATGNDPDYFFVRIYNGEADSLDFYLADFRFADNTGDYIVNEWTYVDLSNLGEIESLSFKLFSSDTGIFGINTPAFFCIDDVSVDYLLSAPDPGAEARNSATALDRHIQVQSAEAAILSIYSMEGRLVCRRPVAKGMSAVMYENILPGIYAVVLQSGQEQWSKKMYLR